MRNQKAAKAPENWKQNPNEKVQKWKKRKMNQSQKKLRGKNVTVTMTADVTGAMTGMTVDVTGTMTGTAREADLEEISGITIDRATEEISGITTENADIGVLREIDLFFLVSFSHSLNIQLTKKK